ASLAESMGLTPGRRHTLIEVVRALRPTVLVGVAGVAGLFTEEVVREMAAHVARPLVFPLSNPTAHPPGHPRHPPARADGRALLAPGSPFGSVTYGGRTVPIGQGNNAFVFPGVGLGVLMAEARKVSDAMFAVAAEALAAQVTPARLAEGWLYPPIGTLRAVTARVAVAVARQARDGGIGRPGPDP